MKACNFASLDPVQQARAVSGLGNASAADRALFAAFEENAEVIAAEAEAAYARRLGQETEADLNLPERSPEGPTEEERTVRARRVQSFFRAAVATSYEHRCAISGVALPELLNASHIVPWSVDTRRRADPRNGILLNTLYDRAFDRGLITVDDSLRVRVSDRLRVDDPPPFHRRALLDIEGASLRPACRFAPDPEALAYHRERVFLSA